MVFARNPNYHHHFTGNVERVELFLVPDLSAELDMYEAGKTDAIGLVPMPSAGVSLDRRRRVGEYVTAPHLTLEYVAFDVCRPPFDDPRVRRAFVMAADRERLADIVLRGYASPATGGFVPPGMPGHSAEIGWPYDPEAARHLLAEAGYPGGAGFPPIDMPAIRGWEPSAEYLAAQWCENLGVEITWATMHYLDHVDRLEQDFPHLYLRGWLADYPDPDNFLRLAVSGIRGYTGWHNQTYDRLVGEAKRVMDQEGRMKLYRRADELLVEEAAIMPLLYGRANLLVKPWVRNYLVPPIGAAPWKHVIIEPH